ncbi:MAG: hypothetical protein KatS3mg081_2942 [Gemmatimonadales bacterium]|nr:MAG: hypothetical protein KatS3mg081_2942 [Gemmatimonadales bacterium]
MNPAVALVQAYLQVNGYLTVTEFPIPGGDKKPAAITDIDLIALRFPGARPLAGTPDPPDPALAIEAGVMDLLICEVKQGKGRLNPNLSRSEALDAALRRVGCCPPEQVAEHVTQLLRCGRAEMAHGGVRCRVRLALFAGRPGDRRQVPLVLSLGYVARAVCDYLLRHQPMLHPLTLTQPALEYLHLLAKLGLLARGGTEPQPARPHNA